MRLTLKLNNYIFMIGAGRLQEPMIKAIKARGYQVLATDRDPNAYCKDLVDLLAPLDTYDVLGHIEYAGSLKYEPKAVLTDAADVGPTVSALAGFYGLPACNLQAATRTRNKSTMRIALDMEHPVYTVNKGEDIYCSAAWSRWLTTTRKADIKHLPAVVKACDNCASRGVTLVNSLDEFEQGYNLALQNNHLVDTVVVEEKLSGQEYATDWLVTQDGVLFANAAQRVFDTFGLEVGHTNPAWEEGEVPARVQYLAEYAVKQLGVDSGPFKIDFLYDDRYGWCILECATRWSGGYDHTHSAKIATGRDLVKPLLDYALGLPFNPRDLVWQTHVASAVYAPTLKRKITAEWLATVGQQAGVVDVIWNGQQPGGKWQSCASREVFIITHGKSTDEAWRLAQQAAKV